MLTICQALLCLNFAIFLTSRAVIGFLPSTTPNYCNANYTTSRDIPPLSASDASLVGSLVQLQVVIRHGARTLAGPYSCWENYDVVWNNCNVTEVMQTSPSYSSPNLPSTFFYRKIYDAYTEELGGNCLTGQLISTGYDQETYLGKSLAKAYFSGDLRLFDTNEWDKLNKSLIYLRSDDYSRVLMSGQIAVYNVFNVTRQNTIVDWHTGDYAIDQIYPNSAVCPRLNSVSSAAHSSSEFQAENTSSELQQLTSDLNAILGNGYWSWNNLFDCFMTAVCTKSPLPDGSLGGPQMTDELFDEAIGQAEWSYAYQLKFNNSLYSKLALGNIAWHISTKIQDAVLGDENALKFVMFAGHDTTVMPLLAALLGDSWDGLWSPYASMISIEIYNSSSTTDQFYFRLVYNGVPMILDGCNGSLCDVQFLVSSLSFGQESMPCSVNPSSKPNSSASQAPSPNVDSLSMSSPPLTTGDWIGLCFMCAVLGGLIASAVIIFSYRNMAAAAATCHGSPSICQCLMCCRSSGDTAAVTFEEEKKTIRSPMSSL